MHVQYVRYKYFVGFSFNRYAYCMYNPLKYTDPTGERCFRWCETSYYIWQKAMQIVLQERLVVYNQAMASTWQLNQMIHAIYSSGSYAGGDTGGGSGYHGCPMGSGGPSGPSGNGQGDGGYSNEFINKCKELGITPGKPIPNDLHTNAFLKDFQEAFYPKAPMEYVLEFIVEGLDNTAEFLRGTTLNEAKTKPEFIDNMFSGCSSVYFNGDKVFESPEKLFYAMGHELIHVGQIIELAGDPRQNWCDGLNYVMDAYAYSWMNAMGMSRSWSRNYEYEKDWGTYKDCLNYTSFPWLYNIKYPYRP